MNHYTYDDIKIGCSEYFSSVITNEKMKMFQEITGDISPIHLDEKYAQRRGFLNRVVYGMLGASYFSTLAGVYLPGEHCLLYETESKFLKPIYIGDVLKIAGVVTDKSEVGKMIIIKVTIRNQNDVLVTKGVIKAGLAK